MDIRYCNGNISGHIIVHQVNTCGVMGSGVAKFLRDKYKGLFTHYKTYLDDYRVLGIDPLGKYSVYIEDGVAVVNLYAQATYGKTGQHTSYEAQYDSLKEFRLWLLDNPSFWHHTYPRFSTVKLGCGLGGGDWNVTRRILEEVFNPLKGSITIWQK